MFWTLPISSKVNKDFSAWNYHFVSFSKPIPIVYFYIIGYNFVMHARIFMFNFDSFLSQKRIQTAGLSKYFVNYTKYIMACTLRLKFLCSRIWIVIPRQWLIVVRSLISFFWMSGKLKLTSDLLFLFIFLFKTEYDICFYSLQLRIK